MSSQLSSGNAPKLFPHTRWTVVLAASRPHSPESAAALETICRAYWYPLYAFVRRSGQSPQDAQDLTQEFFSRLLDKNWLETADRAKGRLRTFLIVALKNFMSKEWRRESAQKRGGGRLQVEFDTAFAESHYATDPSAQLAPDAVYDRQWALTLLERTVARLQAEFSGKPGEFDALKGCLMSAHGAIDYEALAAQLGVNSGAVRVSVHRLRKRFRAVYRDELSQTLAEDADLDAELRHLAAALGQQ